MFQRGVIGRQQGRHLEHQAELQFPRHVQSRVAFLRLEGINSQKETMPLEIRRVLSQPQGIGTAQQHQKDTDQVQDFSLGDGQVTFLGEDLMDLCHRPALPKPPEANLDNHLQRKTAATHGQMAGSLRSKDPLLSRTFPMGTLIAHAHHQVTPIQKDHVFSPERVTALQDTPTPWTRHLFRPIVTLGNASIVFGSSHRHTSLARGLWKHRFYFARGM